MLEQLGHAVTIVGDGRQALQALEVGSFEVVLMDIQMPVMDGLEAVAALRAREQAAGGHVPVLALTAHAMTGDRERCLAAGCDGYLVKPIRSKALRAALGALNPTPGGLLDLKQARLSN